VPPGVLYHPDVTYCTLGKTNLKLDLAFPQKGEGPFPAVIIIHGGGWFWGSHKSHVPLALKLAQRGYVAVTIGYRFAPTHRFPAQVHDVKGAARWLRANAARYKVDKDRIGALGYSSGGHLACMLGTTSGLAQLEGEGNHAKESSRVQAVVSYYGLTDLTQLYASCVAGELPTVERNLMRVVLERFVGGTPDRAADRYAKASPITYASAGSAPTLLIHGTADRKVPLSQSQRFEKRLKEVGAKVRLMALEGAPHDFEGDFEQRANAAALAFFDQHLKR
jgi:acetyl esterase/lipase